MQKVEKVRLVEEIVNPHFTLELNFMWDVMGGHHSKVSSVEELQVLHFKRRTYDLNGRLLPALPKAQLDEMVDKVKKLNIGKSVEYIKVQGIGQFIVVDMTPPPPMPRVCLHV